MAPKIDVLHSKLPSRGEAEKYHETIRRFIKHFKLKKKRNSYGIYSWRFNAKYGKKIVPMEVIEKYERIMYDVPVFIIRTLEVFEGSRNLATIELTFYGFNQAEVSNIHRSDALGLSGTEALELAVSILRLLGCRDAILTDVSSILCEKSSEYISLSLLEMFKGKRTWYEKKGFKFNTGPSSKLTEKDYHKLVDKALDITIGQIIDDATKGAKLHHELLISGKFDQVSSLSPVTNRVRVYSNPGKIMEILNGDYLKYIKLKYSLESVILNKTAKRSDLLPKAMLAIYEKEGCDVYSSLETLLFNNTYLYPRNYEFLTLKGKPLFVPIWEERWVDVGFLHGTGTFKIDLTETKPSSTRKS
mgnify:CR=1 FL=1